MPYLQNAGVFLIQTLFGFFIVVFLLRLLLIAVASLAPVGHTAVPDGQAAIDATRTVG